MSDADFLSASFQAAIQTTIKPTAKLLKSGFEKVQVDFHYCFSEYLKRSCELNSVTKTLMTRGEPVPVDSIYVHTDFNVGKEVINSSEILKLIIANRCNLIFGTAGSGKSLFTKMIFTSAVSTRTGFIPVLVELRNLKTQHTDIEELTNVIHRQIASIHPDFTVAQMDYALRKGMFFLIFDGYDETPHNFRETIAENIKHIANIYSKSIVVVTSRPDERIEYLNEFVTINARPLNLDQAIEVVEKINFDQVVKDTFSKELKNSLFSIHREFLSNPLLLNIMLLTYGEIASVPSRMHVFYEHAFLALFYKHDASKEVYQREHHSDLDIDEFKSVLSAFSLLSIADSNLTISRSDVIKYINQSLEIELSDDRKVKAENYLLDLTESVCILQSDGFDEYKFSHKSFQEYFAAFFISNNRTLRSRRKIIHQLFQKHTSRRVVELLIDMNKDLVYTEWLLPQLLEIQQRLRNLNTEKRFSEFVSYFLIDFRSDGRDCNAASSWGCQTTVGISIFELVNSDPELSEVGNLPSSGNIKSQINGQYFFDHATRILPAIGDDEVRSGSYQLNFLLIPNNEIENAFVDGYFQEILVTLERITSNLQKKLDGKVQKMEELLNI